MTAAPDLDIAAAVAAITATLKERADPAYEWGMRRTVPSKQPAHAVRVPEIRRVAQEWTRSHRDVPAPRLAALAEALWQTGWREERILAIALVGRRAVLEGLLWKTVVSWSADIDNWEHVDNMAGMLTGPMLAARPQLLADVQGLSRCTHVWQRRLAIVTLIEAARDDDAWLPELKAMTAQLSGDRGPTMRKAVDWARRTALKVEARVG